jgi:hypothetical protein
MDDEDNASSTMVFSSSKPAAGNSIILRGDFMVRSSKNYQYLEPIWQSMARELN